MNKKIFSQDIKFIRAVDNIKQQYPKSHLPQIAFIGKSNVGKSSLINKLCNRRNLARTSNTPGRTRQINFFQIADKFLITDLPGYGFARVSQEYRKNWNKLIPNYLENNENLKLINILIDARHGIKENDEIINIFTSGPLCFLKIKDRLRANSACIIVRT